MLYIDDSVLLTPRERVDRCYGQMSEQRKEHVNKFALTRDRVNGIMVYDLLKRGLAQEKGIIIPPVFIFGQYGKPFLRDYPEIFFSLSHCSKAVACVIGDKLVGVDIETIKPIDNSIINYTCNEEEKKEIMCSVCPEIEFTKIWTKKESYLKMIGSGINGDIKEVLRMEAVVNSRFTIVINESKQYVCCCCEMGREDERPL